jgi:cytochrome c5
MKRTHIVLALAAVALMAVPAPASAQQEDNDQRSTLDGVYTAEQASRGETVYRQECSLCHAPNDFSGAGFMRAWNNRSVAHLFNMVFNTMPQDSPGRLRPEEYAAVISYFFKLNGMPEGDEELPTDDESLNKIRIQASPDS